LIEALANSEELSMFKTDLVKDCLEFRWQGFAFGFHFIGALTHLIKQIALILYINYTYLDYRGLMKKEDGSYNENYYISYKENALPDDYWLYCLGIVFVMLFHPLWKDLLQVFQIGPVRFLSVGVN
jgi:hypothetical protein